MKNKLVQYILFIIGAYCITLSSYKAYHASITHDEALTFLIYAGSPVMDIINYEYPSANNHLFNTLLVKFFSSFLGSDEWVLRLPNLLAHFLYLLFTLLIVKQTRILYRIPFFILLNFNPYLLEFFSLSRGYGLSIGFMMGAIYFFLMEIELTATKKYIYTCLFASFSVLSNFTNIYFLFALLAIYSFKIFWQLRKNKSGLRDYWKAITNQKWSILVILILLIILYNPMLKLIEKHQLYFGGDNGFWDDTVNGLIFSSLNPGYTKISYNTLVFWVQAFILTILVISTISIYFKSEITKFFSIKKERLYTISCIIWLIFFIVESNHYFFGTKYLIKRTALFLIPIFLLNFVFLMDLILENLRFKWVLITATYLLSGILIFHLSYTYNSVSFRDWTYDSNTKQMLKDLETYIQTENPNKQVQLGISWEFEPGINYYLLNKNLTNIKKVNREGPQINQDYFYIMQGDWKQVEGCKVDTLITYNSINETSYLLRNKHTNATK